jgi:hypothetical protein
MRRRRTVVAIAGVAGLILAAWLRREHVGGDPSNLNSVADRAGNALPPAHAAATLGASRSHNRHVDDARWTWWHEMETRDSKFEWKMPIRFYGKVVDDSGRPVDAAQVQMRWTDMSLSGSSVKQVSTDRNGLFTLEGVQGKRLTIDVAKPGFASGIKAHGSFEYAAFFEPSYYQPDSDNPVVFELVRRAADEPLAFQHAEAKLNYDSAPVFYDLDQGVISKQACVSGFKITTVRTASPPGDPFDWSFTIEAINGVLQPTIEEFAQFAPENGYQPAWQTSMSATAQPFTQNATVQLYVRNSRGEYGKVIVELTQPNRREVGAKLAIKSYFNPSGSRNVAAAGRFLAY